MVESCLGSKSKKPSTFISEEHNLFKLENGIKLKFIGIQCNLIVGTLLELSSRVQRNKCGISACLYVNANNVGKYCILSQIIPI